MIRLEISDLQRPVVDHNPVLQKMAEVYLKQLPKGMERSFTEPVRAILRRFFGESAVSQARVAAELGLHPRT